MFEDLQIVLYPDPILKKMSAPVPRVDDEMRALATRMLELMREAKGVGLAAPQVGKSIRLFVMNHTGQPGDDRVYFNPELTDADGSEEGEEGCLSLPELHVNILRHHSVKMNALDLSGHEIHELAEGYVARIWQHELDHLNGTLLVDRMGPVARMRHRSLLKELEQKYYEAHPEAVKKKRR